MRTWFLPLLCAGCATGAPVALPRTALSGGTVGSVVDGVDIRIEPVNERNWTEHSALKARLQWNEPVMWWGLDAPGPRDVVVPLVPLPSFEVTIVNNSPDTVSFADAEVSVEDETGRGYRVFESASAYIPRVVDRLAGGLIELTPQTIAYNGLWPAPWGWTAQTLPSEALAEEARKVPLVNRLVRVAPGEAWHGALVAGLWAASPDELARILRGRVGVVMRGVHVGTRELEAQTFTFDGAEQTDHVVCNDGTNARTPAGCPRPDGYTQWMPGGPCLQVGQARQQFHSSLVYDVQYLDGRRVTNADVYEAMLNTPASRAAAKRARSMRVAGYALLGAGVGGAALTAGALGLSHHSSEAPAGLSVLGLSAVGGLLVWLGRKQELTAVRDYNQFAFTTGACAAPL